MIRIVVRGFSSRQIANLANCRHHRQRLPILLAPVCSILSRAFCYWYGLPPCTSTWSCNRIGLRLFNLRRSGPSEGSNSRGLSAYTIPLKLYANHANGRTNKTIHPAYNFSDSNAPLLKGKFSNFLPLTMSHIADDGHRIK